MTKKQDFEDALNRLEQLVEELESGETRLDDMLKKYEEGTALLKFCLEKLDKADQQIKKLTGNPQNGFKLEPFEEE